MGSSSNLSVKVCELTQKVGYQQTRAWQLRILVDIVHPADVLFFKRPLEMLLARHDEVQILSRHKDVACGLLDEFGLAHTPVSTAGKGVTGLGMELITRDLAVIRVARKFKPDVMIGFGGIAISHVGRLLRAPSISFYDSENAKLQTRITWPFIKALYVPQSYEGPTPADRTTRLPGTKELSYLHPSGFTADKDKAIAAGFEPGIDNFLVRNVAWRANHDIAKTGWSLDRLRAVVAHLGNQGRVHISSEVALPDDLVPLHYAGSISQIHHLMAHCRLIVGESATMASEAGVLGVPAIYNGHDFPGYVRELERAGLVSNLPGDADTQKLMDLIAKRLAIALSETQAARDRYVTARPDWALAVINAIDEMACKTKGARP